MNRRISSYERSVTPGGALLNRNVEHELYLEDQRLAKKRKTYFALAESVLAGAAAAIALNYFGADPVIGKTGAAIVAGTASYPVFRHLL